MAEERASVATLVLTLSYDGAPFAGFARQEGHDTVQGRLESALGTVMRREVESTGAGRTDAGVHALAQVVSVPLFAGEEPDLPVLLRSLNALVGGGIVVTGAHIARPGFSARFDAQAREYRYRLVPGPVPPLFLRDVAWWMKHGLDVEAMRTAAEALVGEHDFRSFCVAESAEGKRTVRRIEAIDITSAEEFGEHCVVVRVVGNAFLHSMVRVIVGSLVEVGRGRRSPEWLGETLAACDRAAAGPTAPAHGLVLWHVSYAEECWL